MSITAEEVVERQIVIQMRETEARKLKSLMMYQVDWHNDEFGDVAEQIYEALSGADVPEA